MQLQDIIVRINGIKNEITSLKESSKWVRPEHFDPLIERFNKTVKEFNAITGRNSPQYGKSAATYSSTGKTISDAAIASFLAAMELMVKEITVEIENKHKFRCFKVGAKCPHSISGKQYQFFIGMPFGDDYRDIFEYGIKTLFETHGIKYYRADQKISNIDIMCKICHAIQDSEYIIINVSSSNPNVMFELGLAYGLSKQVLIIKDKKTSDISDLKGLEYLEYSHAGDLNQKLHEYLKVIGAL